MQGEKDINDFAKISTTNLLNIGNIKKCFGPAFIISVAYIDPGNFATNISGGSTYGYTLLWVVLWSNLIAIFLQTKSAKVGIATRKNLPELCSDLFSRKLNVLFWIIAEIGAMATDLAEFLGASLGIYLLLGIPMLPSAFIAAIFTLAVLYFEKYGQKIVEITITAFVSIICIMFCLELFLSKPAWNNVISGTLFPSIPDKNALLLAIAMLGATVMPHVIYLHSQLVQFRSRSFPFSDNFMLLKLEKFDIFFAMNIAFIINASIIILAASVFYKNSLQVDSIQAAENSLYPLLGSLSSKFFGIALLCSGLSSSAVGTLAGQSVMKGFIKLDISVNVRRLVTMAPALIIIALGINSMEALIYSQVVLSFVLPFPIIQLVYISCNKNIMGNFADKGISKLFGLLIALFITILNGLLIIINL